MKVRRTPRVETVICRVHEMHWAKNERLWEHINGELYIPAYESSLRPPIDGSLSFIDDVWRFCSAIAGCAGSSKFKFTCRLYLWRSLWRRKKKTEIFWNTAEMPCSAFSSFLVSFLLNSSFWNLNEPTYLLVSCVFFLAYNSDLVQFPKETNLHQIKS